MSHAELGASGAYRWMACPASIRLSRGLPSTSSDFARLGTVAHTLAEYRLFEHLEGRAVPALIGNAIDPDHPDILVDEEMLEAVQVYEEHALDLLALSRPEGMFLLEERVNLRAMGGIGEIMFGTADLIVFVPRLQTVFLRDYKHGAGVAVEIEANPQLRYYALGAVLKTWEKLGAAAPIRFVNYGVIQPRCPHPDGPVRTEEINLVELMEWADDLLDAAERTQDEDAPVVPGKHCRFCPAQATCPAVRDQKLAQAKLVFGEDGKLEQEGALETLSVAELKVIVDNADGIIAWVRAAQQMAHTRLENGLEMPGYKLVAKKANRSWVDENNAVNAILAAFDPPVESLYKTTLLSPAQIEKTLKLDKNGKAVIAGLTQSLSSGTTLAPIGDKRPASEAKPRPLVEDVFEELD